MSPIPLQWSSVLTLALGSLFAAQQAPIAAQRPPGEQPELRVPAATAKAADAPARVTLPEGRSCS